MDAIQMVGNLP